MFQLFEEILFPRCCAACGTEIESGLLCGECRKGLAEMRSFPPVEYLDGGLIMFAYEGCVKQAIHAVKFSHDKRMPYILKEEAGSFLRESGIRRSVSEFLAEAGESSARAETIHEDQRGRLHYSERLHYPEGLPPEPWIWSGIPTDAGRMRRRGFDLPVLLFEKRAPDFGGTWRKTLCRTRETLPMYGLGPEERRQNLQECFATVRNVAGRSVLLVDDIFTTGTTFSAAAEVLKKAGAAEVKGLAFCGSVENLR